MSDLKMALLLAWIPCLGPHASAGPQLELPPEEGQAGNRPPAPGGRPEKKERGGLELPPRIRGDLAPGSERTAGLSMPEDAPLPVPEASSLGGHAAGRFVLETLAGTHDRDSAVAKSAALTLVDLGPAGLAAARVGLASSHPPTLWVCGMFLLDHGAPEDRRLLADRMNDRVPASIAAGLFQGLVKKDPVLVSPSYVCGLLDHPTGALRQSAAQLLSSRPERLPFASLVPLLDSKRSTTRLAAVRLLSLIPERAATNLLLSALGDASAKVAAEAAAQLAFRGGEQTTELLRAQAFNGRWGVERDGAYALLALVRREEQFGERLFRDEDVPLLLDALESRRPLVAGAAAVALAGIGFRSPLPRATGWLDREVPHLLVRLCMGVEFHNDLSSLVQPASERLSLLSGESFGLNGNAWQSWWSSHATGFKARRGAISVPKAETSLLELDYSVTAGDFQSGMPLRFIGPAVTTPVSEEGVVYLNAAESNELVGLLRAKGVLSAERLGDGDVLGLHRRLALRVDEREKVLSFGADHDVPWFEEIEGRLARLREHNLWQRYGDVEEYGSRREFWDRHHEWWDQATPRERGRRLKDLMLAEMLAPEREQPGTFEHVVGLYSDLGVPEAADFPAFLELLQRESFWNARARSLFELARTSAVVALSMEARSEGASIEPERGGELLALTVRCFGDSAYPVTYSLLEELGVARVRAAAEATGTGDIELRRLAAQLLASYGTKGERELALELCDDPQVRVAEAAIRSLGVHRVEEARGFLEARATRGAPSVRAAALVALARLGGDGVDELALETLAEHDPVLKIAAVEALAELSDPAYASLLAALFSRGPESILFEPAHRGLRRLGPRAWPDLLRLTRSRNDVARRPAALLLARQGVPEAASILMTMLTERPDDPRVREELATLTCVDFSGAEDPVHEYWNWWDQVVHDDSLVWLLAAAAREGFSAPEGVELQGKGTLLGAHFLVGLIQRSGFPLALRAERELSRLLGRDLEIPRDGASSTLFSEELRQEIAEVYGR
ncbi:MAG: hypothetical protein CMJ89_10760 [Planctomycetes bacterium]|nr:hypothetical protein [Planctomycetota bacterium]